MTIADRIKKIIQDEGISRSQFGRDIDVSPTSVAKLCSGENNPSRRTVTLICERYRIRREWLESGEEPMRMPPPDNDDIQDVMNEILDMEENPFYDVIRAMVAAYSKLDKKTQAAVRDYAAAILSEREKKRPDD